MKARYTFRLSDVKELNEMWERGGGQNPIASTCIATNRRAERWTRRRLIYVIKVEVFLTLRAQGCNAAPSRDATEMQVTTRGPHASQMADGSRARYCVTFTTMRKMADA